MATVTWLGQVTVPVSALVPIGSNAAGLRRCGRVDGSTSVTTGLQDIASTTPPSRRRIVGYNPSISGFTACGLLGVFGFCWGLLASPPNDASNLLNVLPPICLMATVFCLLGTCRLVVDPSGALCGLFGATEVLTW
jgi:hypothetical protein